jgi:hypothetical protein
VQFCDGCRSTCCVSPRGHSRPQERQTREIWLVIIYLTLDRLGCAHPPFRVSSEQRRPRVCASLFQSPLEYPWSASSVRPTPFIVFRAAPHCTAPSSAVQCGAAVGSRWAGESRRAARTEPTPESTLGDSTSTFDTDFLRTTRQVRAAERRAAAAAAARRPWPPAAGAAPAQSVGPFFSTSPVKMGTKKTKKCSRASIELCSDP